MSHSDAEPLSIAEASRRGVSQLVADAERGRPTILRRQSEPVAAVIGYAVDAWTAHVTRRR